MGNPHGPRPVLVHTTECSTASKFSAVLIGVLTLVEYITLCARLCARPLSARLACRLEMYVSMRLNVYTFTKSQMHTKSKVSFTFPKEQITR